MNTSVLSLGLEEDAKEENGWVAKNNGKDCRMNTSVLSLGMEEDVKEENG